MANRQVSDSRKMLYYGGMAVTGVGILLFLSNFFGSISPGSALGGMFLFVAGAFMRSVGAKGLAGSGVILDPERARKDVEPWSRMGGGMISDALDESGVDLSAKASATGDFDDKLRKLHQLRQDGILTEEEYQKEKADILEEL